MTIERASHPARIVLVNPAMDIAQGFGDFAKIMEPMPCIGIAYLAAALRQAGHQVKCIDNFALNLPFNELLKQIDDFKADVVGQSCLTPTAQVAFEFNHLLKEKRPGIKTVLGNVHASVFAKQIIEKKQSDYILEGESEASLPRLLDAIQSGRDLSSIPGLYYPSPTDGSCRFTGPSQPFQDLDLLPRPDWSDLPWRKYTFLPFVTIALPVMAIMGSRGCPYKCTFCALNYQGRYRVRSPESIVDEMDWLIRDFAVKHIGFVDPLFPLKKIHLLEMCRLIRDRNFPRDVAWTSETRVDCVDKEMMEEMKSAGMRRILFGIESGDDQLLENVSKNFTVAQVKQTIAWAKQVGLETSCFFILGLPGETRKQTLRTISFPIELDVDFAKFAILVPLPGSPLYDQLVDSGKLAREDWARFTTFNISSENLPFVPDDMTGQELLTLQRRANMGFYFRPGIILRHLFKIRTIPIKHLLLGLLIWLKWNVKKAFD